jgi:hypothetical protein
MTRPWTRLAEKQWCLCASCEKEFYAIRSDARFCSARCRQHFCRSKDGKMKRLKRLAKQHETGAAQQWELVRNASENRIAQALVNHDPDQLAKAFHELRYHKLCYASRKLPFHPYRSFATYCRERWHLDPEKVEQLINPFINPIIRGQ